MPRLYLEDEIIDPRPRVSAYDTSGVPVPPPVEGFSTLGQVQGTATSNAYIAEQDRRQFQEMTPNQRAEAEQAAIRFSGQQKYRALIEGGAKPAEALRLAGPELFYNNPTALVNSIRATREVTPFEPSVIERGGTKFAVTGPNRAEVIKPERVTPKMPQENVDQRRLLDAEIRSLTSQLTELQPKVGDKTELALNPKLPAQVADLTARLQSAKDRYLNFGTNWIANPNPNPAPKVLTREIAAQLLRDAGGNKEAARKLAREAGYAL